MHGNNFFQFKNPQKCTAMTSFKLKDLKNAPPCPLINLKHTKIKLSYWFSNIETQNIASLSP